MKKIFLSFVVYSLAELALLIVIGQKLGVFSTLLLIVATSIFGIYVAKNKGMHSVRKVKDSLAHGEAPGTCCYRCHVEFEWWIVISFTWLPNRYSRFIATDAIHTKNVPTNSLLLDA